MNHDVFLPVLAIVGAVFVVGCCRKLGRTGRSVNPDRYSIINSVSACSLIGDVGTPNRTLPDSPENRLSMNLFFVGDGDRSGIALLYAAAQDFARECKTLPDRDNAAAAGCALDIVVSNLDPRPSRTGRRVVLVRSSFSCISSKRLFSMRNDGVKSRPPAP